MTSKNRMLITKLTKRPDGRIDLFGRGHKWPDLLLHEQSDLLAVGLNPEKLPTGQEMPCRFYAVWQHSDKLNQAGNPYKNIVDLEPDHGAGPASPPPELAELAERIDVLTALVAEVLMKQGGNPAKYLGQFWQKDAQDRAKQRQTRVAQQAEQDKADPDPDTAFPQYGDGTAPSGDNSAELEAFAAYQQAEGRAPQNVETLRQWYTGQNGN